MASPPDLKNYIDIVKSLHVLWTPHPGQIKAGSALFGDDIRSIFIQCGRKWGKTEFGVYILWRWAQMYPEANCYYIAPLLTQAKEIIWADPRMQNFGPRKWLLPGTEGINNSEMRLRFTNGSFIKVDGSDNYEKHRGTRPSILVYEEFKDHRKEFRDVMRPNLSVYDAPEIFIGTPPEDTGDEATNEFLLTAKEHQDHPKKFFHHAPSYENHHISTQWLKEEKERLYARGEGDVWEREYEAKYVKGGARKIFPMLDRSIIVPHAELMKRLAKDLRKIEWYVCADPAGASCFAVLFAGLNPYTKEWFIVDEIYALEQSQMTVKVIGPQIAEKTIELSPRSEWRKLYDEAATWFSNEMLSEFGESFEPTQKSKSDKISGLSLIKDILLSKKIHVSDRCEKFYWELDKYCKDKSGKIPKVDDHLIDDFRYILDASYYGFTQTTEYLETKDENFRGATIAQDIKGWSENGEIDEWNLNNSID
jgi:hypothetical protein